MTQKNEPLITALYERLSHDDDQQGDSNSIVNQKSYLTTYAADHGFTHCRHYTDDGYSGGNFERPGWKQLIADIDAGLVGTVIAKDLSRIGRDYIQTGFYTEVYFRRKGVRFIAINNGIDNTNPDSTEFAGILNIMNDWYLRDQSRKLRCFAQQKGQSGKNLTNNPCFGYVKDPNDKNHWLVDPEAADTVRRIYELAAAGVSQLNICRTMVKEQRVTPGYYRAQREPNGFGGQFSQQQPYHWAKRIIQQIVRRREYLGETVNFKTFYPDLHAKQIENPPEKWLCFPDAHEAIVTPELWQAAQRIYHPNMTSKPGKPCKLTGLVICGECGVPMAFHRSGRNEKSSDYICRTNLKSAGYEQRLCSRNGIQVAVIRQIVADTLRTVNRYAITDEEAFRHRLEQEAMTIQPDDRKQLAKQIRAEEKQIARLEHLLKKLYEDYALGRIQEERFDKMSALYEQEEASLRAKLEDDQARLSEAQAGSSHIDQYLALARKYRDCTELTDDMIRSFVEKIVVHKTIRPENGQRTRQIEVHLNYIGQFPIPTEGMENENE